MVLLDLDVAAMVEPEVLEELVALLVVLEAAVMEKVEYMAAALEVVVALLLAAVLAQSVSFIPARHVHSHQQIQETCNA
jgi:hypothetical protein